MKFENILKGCLSALFLLYALTGITNPPAGTGQIEVLRKGCVITQKDSLFGIQCKKDIVAEPVYRKVLPFQKLAALQNTSGQWLFVNQAGKFINAKAVDSFAIVKDTLIVVKEENRWGMLGLSGKQLLPVVYKSVTANAYGNVLTQQFNHYTVYEGNRKKFEQDGELLKPVSAQNYLWKANTTTAILNDNGQRTAISVPAEVEKALSGEPAKQAVQTSFVSINKAMEAARVKLSGPEGQDVLTNSKGKVLWKGNWSLAVVTCVDSMIYIQRDNRLEAIINPKGEQALEHFQKYDIIEPYSEGYARVKRAGKWGFISRSGGLFVATQYDTVTRCSQFRAGVLLKNKWGVIDLHEHLLAQPYYDSVGLYQDSVVIVKKDGKYGLLAYNGQELFIPKYDRLERLAPKIYKVRRSNREGVLSSKGNELVFTKYERIAAANAEYLVFQEFGKLGVINFKDQILIPAEQEQIYLNPFNKDIIVVKKGAREVLKY